MENRTEIRIERDDRSDGTVAFHVSLWKEGKCHEYYRPVNEKELPVFVSSLMNGFDPPKRLLQTVLY